MNQKGSSVHMLIMDPVLDREDTSSLSDGNDTTPETAFIAWSGLETYTLAVNS